MTSQSTVLVFDFLNTSIREFFLIFVFTLGKTIRISQFYFEQIQFNSNRITKGPLENSMNMELSGNRRIVESYLNSQPSISQSVSQSVQSLSPVRLCDLMNCTQQARPPCASQTSGVHSNSCLSSQRCHPAILSSVVPFSSCPQSVPASGSFPTSQLFASGGQSPGVSASALVLPVNTQD